MFWNFGQFRGSAQVQNTDELIQSEITMKTFFFCAKHEKKKIAQINNFIIFVVIGFYQMK